MLYVHVGQNFSAILGCVWVGLANQCFFNMMLLLLLRSFPVCIQVAVNHSSIS